MAAQAAPARNAFSRGLGRQIAARGALDDVYRELSDHWTVLIQELYPVWMVVGPGLAEPGEIDLRARTIYLDSDELIGTREDIVAGRLDRYRVLTCFGVAFHEVMHARHTKRWVVDYDEQLVKEQKTVLFNDRRLLEEPRMEAHGVRDHPLGTTRGRFIRRGLSAAVASVILPRFSAQVLQLALTGAPLTREVCGRAMTYLAARTHYGVVDPATLGALTPLWEAVLGAADMQALHDLYARLIWIPDGELNALDTAAAAYRDIIGPPDPPPPGASQVRIKAKPTGKEHTSLDGDSGAEAAGEGADAGEASEADEAEGNGNPATGVDESADADGATLGSLADALQAAGEHARAGQLEQLDEEVVLEEVLARAEGSRDRPSAGRGTGAPTGRMPKRAVNRPPLPDEVRAAIRFANRLEQARTQSLRQIAKRTPGGRFHPRNHVRAMAQRQHGRPVTAHPWSIERTLRNPIRGPHVIFIVDTSGSMAIYEYALGPIVWIIDTGLRMVGGRMATALFGNTAELLSDGRSPMRLVPGIRTGGGTAFAGDAMVMCADELEMDNLQRPRLAYILSDGGWYDTQAGVAKIERLAALGVPTIHIALLHEPLSVLAARISVITDPADALTVVAEDSVLALQTPPRALPAGAATHAA